MEGYASDIPLTQAERDQASTNSAYMRRIRELREAGRQARMQGLGEDACRYRSQYRTEWLRGYREQAR